MSKYFFYINYNIKSDGFRVKKDFLLLNFCVDNKTNDSFVEIIYMVKIWKSPVSNLFQNRHDFAPNQK